MADEPGRTLLIIGGRQGLGQAITELANEHYRDHWSKVMPMDKDQLDVRDYKHLRLFAQDLLSTEGDLDIVYCAGVNLMGAIGDIFPVEVEHTYQVNVGGFINVLNEFWPIWKHARVNVTAIVSDSSRVPMRGSIMYASSKAALAHAVRCAARELAPHWRVNGVSPGVIDGTPMTDKIDKAVPELRGWSAEEAMTYELSLVPMGRRATKVEVASLVLQTTMGPEFLTGSIIDITGGK